MCLQLTAGRAGLFAEPIDGHPHRGSSRRAEPAKDEANSLRSLRPEVIAFEHNVNLDSVQEETEIDNDGDIFHGILIPGA